MLADKLYSEMPMNTNRGRARLRYSIFDMHPSPCGAQSTSARHRGHRIVAGRRRCAPQDRRDGRGARRQDVHHHAVPVRPVQRQVQAHRRGDAQGRVLHRRRRPDAGHSGHVRIV